MSIDVEERLREALQARAAQVEAGPGTWVAVQERLRRSRRRRAALAGVAAVAAVVVAAVALPALLGGGTVQLDSDVPVADQPERLLTDEGVAVEPGQDAGSGEQVEVEPGPTFCFTPATIAAVWSSGGDLWSSCANGSLTPITEGAATDRHPAVAPDGSGLVFERTEPGQGYPVLVYRPFAEDAGETVLGGGGVPAFAPDGRLARVLDAGDGGAVIQIGDPFGEPEHEAGVPYPAQDVRSLQWGPDGDVLLYTVAADGGVAAWSYVPQDGDHRLLLAPEHGYAAVAFGLDGALVGLQVDRQVRHAEVRVVALDPALLGGEGEWSERTLGGLVLADPDSQALSLIPAGFTRFVSIPEGMPRAWRSSRWQSWFVGHESALYVVDRGGRVQVAADAAGAAANPVVELAEPGQPDGRERAEAEREHRAALQERARAEHERLEERLEEERGAEQRERAAAAAEAATVETARRRVVEAARGGDLTDVRDLMAPDFDYSFGRTPDRDGALEYFASRPGLADHLVDLLAAPHGVIEQPDGALYVWPNVHALDPAQWSAADLATLRGLGASDADIEAWRAGEGYTGPRAGITADGVWRFYVAGD